VGTFAGNVPFAFNYESGFIYEFGVTRYLADGYFVSAGYMFSENSVPDATLSPLNPDSDLHLGNIGFGKHGENWSWAVGYHFAAGERDVRGNLAGVNGKFETFNHGLNVVVRRSF